MNDIKKSNSIPIEEIMSDSYAKYAKYIIQDRALPDARDGLKPVQRRILYAMNQLQLFYNQPHKKSARTVGEVIGKYHPHGDYSIYEAMVRLSQDWKNNICLLDMHGNKGSIDGDSPAAMRYTECRLSQFGQMLIENIKKDCVKFIENFDGSEKEPTVLPSLYPNLLINGATGIAAGYATNIPPFNPSEVINAIIAKIDTPNCRVDRILNLMPAPDFPTGGTILDLNGVREAYNTGKGKITIRATIEKINNKQLVIKDIPYETNKSEIIRSIDTLKEKIDTLNIVDVRDESDGNGISIVIDTKNNANFEFIKNCLYKNTRLQISYNLNMVAIVNRKPVLMPILDMIQTFIEHADLIILNISKFDLNKSLNRKEIIKGLIKAITIIDDVVSTIRSSSNKADAIDKLIITYNFSNNQAEAIVNLRLYKLTNTDVQTLEIELNELELKINELESLVNNQSTRNAFLKNKLYSFKKSNNFKRKSKLGSEETKIQLDELDFIEDRESIFVFTKNGYMKNITKKAYLANDFKDNKVKEDDLIINQYIANFRDKTLLFTNEAKVLTIPNYKIESHKIKDIGMHINNLLTLDSTSNILLAVNCPNVAIDHRQVITISKNGLIKRVEIDELISKKSAKIINCGKLDEGDTIKTVKVLNNHETDKILIITRNGFANIYQANQIPQTSKNVYGVKAIKLKNGDEIASMMVLDSQITHLILVTNYGLKRIELSSLNEGNRSNSGRPISSFIASNNSIKILKILPYNSNNLLYSIFEDKSFEYIDPKQINYLNNNAKIYSVHPQLIDCENIDLKFISSLKENNE